MTDDELEDAWADIVPPKPICPRCQGTGEIAVAMDVENPVRPCPSCSVSAPSMPFASIRLGKHMFQTIGLHNAEHFVNLIPDDLGRWRIQGFTARWDGDTHKMFWTRQGGWLSENVTIARAEVTFEPYELEEQIELAITFGRTPF